MCLCVCVSSGGRTLQILKAKVSDGGKYSCVAISAAGEAYKHIHLTVFGQCTFLLSVIFRVWGFVWLRDVFFSPQPCSSSKYSRQQPRLTCGNECACW